MGVEAISYTSVYELVHGLDKGIIRPALARFDDLVKKAQGAASGRCQISSRPPALVAASRTGTHLRMGARCAAL
jgi:hypothetical protein